MKKNGARDVPGRFSRRLAGPQPLDLCAEPEHQCPGLADQHATWRRIPGHGDETLASRAALDASPAFTNELDNHISTQLLTGASILNHPATGEFEDSDAS